MAACREHPIGGFATKMMVVVARCVRMSGQLVEKDISPVAEVGDGEDSGVQFGRASVSPYRFRNPESAKYAAARAPGTPTRSGRFPGSIRLTIRSET